jgi:pyroglutamyl-peptidase
MPLSWRGDKHQSRAQELRDPGFNFIRIAVTIPQLPNLIFLPQVMRVLVTGFDPFGGGNVNSSLEAIRRLPPSIGPLEITTVELPTSYARSFATLENAIARVQPAIVLCIGEAGDRPALCVERVAINVQDARIADNDGAVPVDVPVVAGGPAAYFATLPVKDAAAALQSTGLPAEVSNSAGTFVCNHVFYSLMHFAATTGRRFRGGLLHVPRLPQQQLEQERNAAFMPLDDIVRGVRIVLEVAATAS